MKKLMKRQEEDLNRMVYFGGGGGGPERGKEVVDLAAERAKDCAVLTSKECSALGKAIGGGGGRNEKGQESRSTTYENGTTITQLADGEFKVENADGSGFGGGGNGGGK